MKILLKIFIKHLVLLLAVLITLSPFIFCEFVYAQSPLQKQDHLFNKNRQQLIPKSFSLNEKSTQVNILKKFELDFDSSVTDIEIKYSDIWLGTVNGADFSSNLGTSWIHFDSTNGLGSGGVSGLSISNDLVAIASAFSQGDSNYSLPVGSGISFSTNNGITWSHFPQPVDDPGDSLITYGINNGLNLPQVRAMPITVAIQNLTYDIAFTTGTVWIASFAGGLRKSTNNGESWQRVLLPSDKLNEISPYDTIRFSLQPVAGTFGPEGYLNHRVFSVIATNDSTLYAGTAGGINKSTDNGISWIKFNHQNQAESISGNFVVALGYSCTNNIVWGATWKAESPDEFYGISSSTNGGTSWNTALYGKRAHNFFSYGDTVIVSTDDGLYRSVNGVSWQYFQPLANDTLYDAIKDTLGRIWVASRVGIRIFNDHPSLWIPMPANNPPLITSIIAPAEIIRPVNGSNQYTIGAYVIDPQGFEDIANVWFTSLKPNGQYAGEFFLNNDGDGQFSLIIMIDHYAQMGTYIWTFRAQDKEGNVGDSVVHNVMVIDTTISFVRDNENQPVEFRLFQNYPNPFNPITTIKYSIPKTCIVTLKVFDVLGNEITTLVNEEKPAGNYEIQFTNHELASGIYLYRMQAGAFFDTKKFILMK